MPRPLMRTFLPRDTLPRRPQRGAHLVKVHQSSDSAEDQGKRRLGAQAVVGVGRGRGGRRAGGAGAGAGGS